MIKCIKNNLLLQISQNYDGVIWKSKLYFAKKEKNTGNNYALYIIFYWKCNKQLYINFIEIRY